jgi:hypothetical protein
VTRIVLFALLVLATFLPINALADEVRSTPSVLVTTSVGYPLALKTETLLPPSISHGAAFVFQLGDGWGYLCEVGVNSGFTAWRPSLLLITGPSKKLAPKFILGASIFYKLAPPYDGATAPTHVLGGSIAPVIPIEIGSISFPTAMGVDLATGDSVLVLNVKLAVDVK